MSARTPGLLRVVANDGSGFWEIHDDAGWLCQLESESTAERIVEACNASDTMVAALADAIDTLDGIGAFATGKIKALITDTREHCAKALWKKV